MAELLRIHVDPEPIVLTARGLSVRAGRRLLLRNIDLSVRRGEVFGVIGPSGAGKSTLLKVFNLRDLSNITSVRLLTRATVLPTGRFISSTS